jgi:GTP pyrophosphokinase
MNEFAPGQDQTSEWLETWSEKLCSRFDQSGKSLVGRACSEALQQYEDRLHASGERMIDHARGVASIVAELRLDAECVAAAILIGAEVPAHSAAQPVPGNASATGEDVLDPGVASLVTGVVRLAPIQRLRAQTPQLRKSSEKAAQLEVIRKMLLAMVEDIRVVLLKLADQLQTLRYLVIHGNATARRTAAQDTFDLLAPLANRLGVWQLKWELEDLAFRCKTPDEFAEIASQLDEKRSDREAYLGELTAVLHRQLAESGIKANVSGRPKHIYSIWKKMQRKGLNFEQLSDVRAVRVLVDNVRDCYAVLGLVHQLWAPITGEFDDYIAKPKSNDYRSLHTAVAGPAGKVVEVQIRTREMHEQAELGVAAHWRYKEASRGDRAYDRRIAWLRQILDWRDEMADATELAESFRSELRDDAVYVLTPQGRVIDLPAGATPVDFAYHVHTELGHRCRGAIVDGRLIPLNQPLKNGQVVEIQAVKQGGPSRDWMNVSLGYVASARVRAKIRQWFNSRTRDEASSSGRAELEKALQRLGQTSLDAEQLADKFGYARPDDLFFAFHRGDISQRELRIAVQGEAEEAVYPPLSRKASSADSTGAVLVVGLDRLLTVLARCCKPAPPDSIVGFVSRGRGITVHRASCANLGHLASERLIEAEWAANVGHRRYETDIEIFLDRHSAPVREVLEVFAHEKVRMIGTSTYARGQGVRMVVTIEIDSLAEVEQVTTLLADVPGVTGARRR